MALPTSGAAWNGVLTWAAKTPNVNLADLNADGDVVTLAKALVSARTGERRAEVIAALVKAQASGVDRALELARGLGAYVLAADLIGYRDPAFVAWVKAQLTRPVSGGPANITACHEERPQNWGSWCGAARVAVDLYIGDNADLARAATVFHGYLGDRTAYAGFKYGSDISWQANAALPVGINPVGATKSGHNIDGVLPDDQRRGGSFTWPTPCENYVWEALAGDTMEAALLSRAGYPVWSWNDAALKRALTWLYGQASCPPTGDDTGTPWIVNHFTGSTFPTTPATPSKGFVAQDWLYGP